MTSTTTEMSENDPEDEKWAQETGTSNVLKCFIFTLTVINFAKSCKPFRALLFSRRDLLLLSVLYCI
jgi:hypothetical protein